MVANDADDTWVRFLHNQGADPNIGDAQERTPLFLMVEKGSHRRVDYMIEKFGASINVRTKVSQIVESENIAQSERSSWGGGRSMSILSKVIAIIGREMIKLT